jgi:Cu(I)/Ag(I) efflux system membrane fusion protein
MRLEPIDEARRPPAGPGATPAGAGVVHVNPDRQQIIGVELGAVTRVSGGFTVRTTGRVAPNENAVYPLVAGGEGWIRDVRGATTGSLVKRHDVLLSIYSPEFVVAQQSYYSGLETLGRVESEQTRTTSPGRIVEGVERYANTLRNLGVSEGQLAEMRARRELHQFIRIVAPIDGFVLARNASVGLRFDRGDEFYRLADLRRVWILADVYENQAALIRAGSTARVFSQDRTRELDATVSQAEPTFDEETSTLKVRLEAENPGLVLKPGMFMDVELPVTLPPTLAIPADALIDSGLRKIVYVDRGEGYFEPRQIETGWRLGDRVEVVKGLMEGERIVVSGTFLIDSESRMKAAARGIVGAAAEDPVCGMQVDEARAAAAGRRSVYQGAAYFFCADECKTRFDRDPASFLSSATRAAGPPPAGDAARHAP